MVVKNLHERVGRTRVVYVVGAIPPAAAVQTPAIVDFTNSKHLSMRSPARLGVGDFLTCVLRNFPSSVKRHSCEASLAVYGRRLDGEAGRELEFH